MRYVRMPIKVESPEAYGYARIRYNLLESSIADQSLSSLGRTVPDLALLYNEHRGSAAPRSLIAAESPPLKPDTHFRIGYGWPTADDLAGGLEAMSKAPRG